MREAIYPSRVLAQALKHAGAAAAVALLAGQAYSQSTNPNDPDYDPVLAGELADAERAAFEAQQQGLTGGMDAVQVAQAEPGDVDVSVSEFQTIDMKLVDEDLIMVLNTLAEQMRLNIVASSDVNATVSANLYDVTFEQALDALLHVNGYAWQRKGNMIEVMTADEAMRREQEALQREHRVVTLNYLNATDAATFVQPLLSEVGEIVSNAAADEFSIRESTPSGAEDFALSSTLVIYDYPEHIEEIVALIETLDTRPSQVLVEATILQTALNEANAFGVDFAIVEDINFIDFFDFGGPLGAPGALSQLFENNVAPVDNQATAISSRAGNFAGPANFRASILAEDVAFFIRALDEVSDTTILSNPKIMTLNRQPARVLVGRKLGYLNTTSTETATTQTVEFLDTGTQLSFRPFVSNDGMIRLELTPRVSEGVIRSATDATGAAVTIPDEITQELTTNVMVPDGATVVLGGLFKETTELTRSQVPFFGDIPLVGAAFRGHDDATDRQEIIFMITPTVINDKQMLEDGERGVQNVERVRVGTRQGLLPWSRDRQTRNLNMEAERLIREGKLDRANHCLRRSLELNPNQPEARRLLEETFNQTDYWPSRSILESIYHGEKETHVEPTNEAPVSIDLSDAAQPQSKPKIVVNSKPKAEPVSEVDAEALAAIDSVLDDEDIFGDPMAQAPGEPAEATFADPFEAGVQTERLDPTPEFAQVSTADAEPTTVADAFVQPERPDLPDPFAQQVPDTTSDAAGGEGVNEPVLDETHFPPQREQAVVDVIGSDEAAPKSRTGSQRKPFGYVPEPEPVPTELADDSYNVPNHTAEDNTIGRFAGGQDKLDNILADIPNQRRSLVEGGAGVADQGAAGGDMPGEMTVAVEQSGPSFDLSYRVPAFVDLISPFSTRADRIAAIRAERDVRLSNVEVDTDE